MPKLELPKFLSCCMDDFQTFYLKNHSGQKLLWCLGLSKVDVQFLYMKNMFIFWYLSYFQPIFTEIQPFDRLFCRKFCFSEKKYVLSLSIFKLQTDK